VNSDVYGSAEVGGGWRGAAADAGRPNADCGRLLEAVDGRGLALRVARAASMPGAAVPCGVCL